MSEPGCNSSGWLDEQKYFYFRKCLRDLERAQCDGKKSLREYHEQMISLIDKDDGAAIFQNDWERENTNTGKGW